MASATPTAVPVRSIPGSYGLPVLGPLKDRLDYFWFQGPDTFFRDRMLKHKSTVFRTNLPPTFPFFVNTNPNVIALLDTKSFSTLFDLSLVEKKDVLVGDYMPSVNFTGKLRVLAYLDPSEPRHAPVKNFAFSVLKNGSRVWVSELLNNLTTMWDSIDEDLAQNGKSGLILPLQKCIFRFLTKSLIGADPRTRPEIDKTGFAVLDSWLALQLLPTTKVGVIPQPLEELLLHSFPFPSFLVSFGY